MYKNIEAKLLKTLAPIFCVFFLDCFAFAISFPLFATLFATPSFGIFPLELPAFQKHVQLAILLSIFPFAQLLSAPILGDLADRFGRKKILLFSILGSSIGSLLSFIGIYVGNYFLLLLSRLLTGLCSGNVSISTTALTDLTSNPIQRSKYLGFAAFITSFGWIMGILFGAIFSNAKFLPISDPSYAFISASLLFLLGAFNIHFFFTEVKSIKEHKNKYNLFTSLLDIAECLKDSKRSVFYFIYLFWVFGWSMTFQWYGIYALQRFGVDISKAAYTQFLNGISGMIGSYLINKILLKKFSSTVIVILAISTTSLCIFGMALSSSFTLFAIFAVIACIPAAVAVPNIVNLLSLTSEQDTRGKVMGLAQSIECLGNVVSALIGGVIGGIFIKYLYPFALAMIILSLFFSVMHLVKLKKQAKI